MRRIARFLRLPRSTARIRADLDDEFRFDIDMRARDLERQGMSADEARARATREFGDLEGTRRYCEDVDMQIEREVRRVSFVEDLRSDLVIAARGMRRAPIFAAVVLLTLALGIGANTAVFSVVRRVLVAPLPFRAPSELYRLYTTPSATDGDDDKLSAVELEMLATQSRAIAGVTWFGNYMGSTYSDTRSAEAWQSVSVGPRFFDVLGVRPIVGRLFQPEDFVRGAPGTLMITYQLWQRTFNGDRTVINRKVDLNGTPFTIVGVLPEGFVGPTFNADVLRPLDVASVLASSQYSRARVWRAVVRVAPGVTRDGLLSELAVMRTRVQSSYPDIKNAGVFLPTPLHEAIVGGAGPILRLVMSGALIVLLAACVNIAGLFLSRSAARRRELGVRTALGAARGRLIRQTLAEAGLYGIAGGALGIVLGVALKGALLRIVGPMLPSLGDVNIDMSVLCFSIGASLISSIAFGMLPALAAARVDVRDALGDGGTRAASRGGAASRASRLLASAQVALAVVLIAGAALFVRTFRSLVSSDLGYETTTHQATFFLSLGARYRDTPAQMAFMESFVRRARAIPGVVTIGYSVNNPWNGTWRNVSFRLQNQPNDGTEAPSAVLAAPSSEWFAAMGIPVKMGRGFSPADRPGTPRVVVISESMAHRFWPSSSPLGARLRVAVRGVLSDTTPAYEVVGVVGDVKENALDEPKPTLYVSAEQTQILGATFVVRTRGDAAPTIPAIKRVVGELDAQVPMLFVRTLSEVLSSLVRRQNVAMTLIGMFAALALVLASLGVYGVVSYNVVARTREFGIRSALGASRASILSLAVRDGLAMMIVGLVLGLGLAIGLSRLVASLLAGVSPHDPVSYIAAFVILGAAAIVACIVPARAAARIQPVEALRLE